MANLEVKKMKQGMSYSCKEKTIILNVFKYFRNQCPDKCVTEIVRRTAKATGCSEKSVFQFRKEEASVEGFKEPSKVKIRKNININSRDIKYGYNVRQSIRNIIYNLKYKNIVPSLSTILKHVNGDTDLPNFSLMTLRRLLFDMGFCYEKNGTKSVLVEKPVTKENAPVKSVKNKKMSNNNSNAPQRISNNEQNIENQNIPVNIPQNNSSDNNLNTNITSTKELHYPLAHAQPNITIPVNHMNQQVVDQGHRMIPMHIPHENHMMHPPVHNSHSVPMMLNHRMGPPIHSVQPTSMDMHLKRDIAVMHHFPPPAHHMVLQQ